MPAISHNTLKILAGLIWFSGAVVLTLKGGSQLAQALGMRPGEILTWLALPAGLLIGSIKSELIFEKACIRNLDRIDALEQLKFWHAYRPSFYVLLTGMIILGSTLSTLATGNYNGLMAMAILDFSLATALLLSSRQFWTHR